MFKTVMCFQGVPSSLQVKFTLERKIAGFGKLRSLVQPILELQAQNITSSSNLLIQPSVSMTDCFPKNAFFSPFFMLTVIISTAILTVMLIVVDEVKENDVCFRTIP